MQELNNEKPYRRAHKAVPDLLLCTCLDTRWGLWIQKTPRPVWAGGAKGGFTRRDALIIAPILLLLFSLYTKLKSWLFWHFFLDYCLFFFSKALYPVLLSMPFGVTKFSLHFFFRPMDMPFCCHSWMPSNNPYILIYMCLCQTACTVLKISTLVSLNLFICLFI